MGKKVLITGASGGIGRKIAEVLARKGFEVLAGCRSEKDFQTLNNLHENISSIYLDVLDKTSLDKAFNLLKDEEIELCAIINNAGAVVAQPIECINIDDLRYQFEINTFAPVSVVQTLLPLLEKGKIINISSMASSGIFPYISPYCASKRAMDILFNSLSIEIKSKDIKVVSVKPGSIKTPIWNKSIENNYKCFERLPKHFQEKYKREWDFLAKNAKKNNYKALEPEKVANTVVKILNMENPKASYCVGFDSIMAIWASKLPQDLLNGIIKFNLNKKLK